LLLLLVAIVVYNVVVFFFNPANVTNPQVELSYSDFISQVDKDNIKDVSYQQGGQITGTSITTTPSPARPRPTSALRPSTRSTTTRRFSRRWRSTMSR